jgi:4-amino-4-deoxy-L-arabinose transferase-like glycosyltransferase
MNLVLGRKRPSQTGDAASSSPLRARWDLSSWLFAWEVYLIVLIAAFLRLYLINTTEFDDDQAIVFRMAHDAVTHGLLVATSNIASIHIVNPPAVIYFFLLPATMSADPLWGAVTVGLCATASVLLTYLFTRRYFGRFAAAIAAFTFATAAQPVYYSRFIWQQNLLPLFVTLYIWSLFWGVVERRKGWLFPALLLLGILIQLHASSILLTIALLVALIFAPGTIRWRDLALGIVSLIVIYFPYLLWEISTNFGDVYTLLAVSRHAAQIDNKALNFYRLFLSPYDYRSPPTYPHSVLPMLVPWISWLRRTMTFLVLGGIALAVAFVVWGQGTGVFSVWRAVRQWWTQLRASAYRCGLIVLLTWQVVPLLILSRHALDLFPHYFIMFLPGPFILIGFFLATVVRWFQRIGLWGKVVRYSIAMLVAVIVIAQFAGSTAAVLDMGYGNFSDAQLIYPYYNDLSSLQHALAEADQVAQQHHLNRVYITTDMATHTALQYLAEQMHTPTTLFDDTRCVVLPNPADGPAVLLVGPYDTLTNILLPHFGKATLVDEPHRLGGPSFRLYIVRSTEQHATGGDAFVDNLRLLETKPWRFSFNNTSWLATYWSLLRSALSSYRTTYMYNLVEMPDGIRSQGRGSGCIFTSMRTGDQVVIAFRLPEGRSMYSSIYIEANFQESVPYTLSYGPISLETDSNRTLQNILQTTRGTGTIHLSGI